ncbi:MAG: transposase [Candidatus Wallbacteria bacterium]|nr:transposase [Candidatus Wallbacteria bacterium]
MKRSWRDGTTPAPSSWVAFEPLDFMGKLAALIPRPQHNLLRFHGVYAPNARLRRQVMAEPLRPASARSETTMPPGPSPHHLWGPPDRQLLRRAVVVTKT